jgi:hypothetical protein
MVLRTFGGRRPPTVAPRSINLFKITNFDCDMDEAEGPKKHLPFARIATVNDGWGPSILEHAERINKDSRKPHLIRCLCHLLYFLNFIALAH